MHLCWTTADLYVDQILLSVVAVTQACCQAVLQSSTEQWGMQVALTSGAMNWCWVTADLYVDKILVGAIAVTQACCQAVLQSSTEQWEMQFALTTVAVHLLDHCRPVCRPNLDECSCSDTSLLSGCFAEQH